MPGKTDFIQAVEKTAILAKLNLTKEKKAQYAQEIEEVLNHFQDINELEVGEVEYFDHYPLAGNNVRTDEKEDFSQEGQAQIKAAFPKKSGEYLKVKAVL